MKPAIRARTRRHSPLLVLGFLLALMVRIVLGGPSVAYAPGAGLVFAALLVGLCAVNGLKTRLDWRTVGVSVLGTAVLLIVPAVQLALQPSAAKPAGNYAAWALTVGVIALAEEAFLRGTFFDTVARWRGPAAAVVTAAVLFTLLHIPLYGWHVVPLDFAAGVWLGLLRLMSGSWLAPAAAHVLADWSAWWLI